MVADIDSKADKIAQVLEVAAEDLRRLGADKSLINDLQMLAHLARQGEDNSDEM